jgi:hypothetical protein
MTMSWILRAVDNGTEIRIVCENVPAEINKHDHAKGLRSSLGTWRTICRADHRTSVVIRISFYVRFQANHRHPVSAILIKGGVHNRTRVATYAQRPPRTTNEIPGAGGQLRCTADNNRDIRGVLSRQAETGGLSR